MSLYRKSEARTILSGKKNAVLHQNVNDFVGGKNFYHSNSLYFPL